MPRTESATIARGRRAPHPLLLALLIGIAPGLPARAADPLGASQPALELDRQIDWSRARLIAVQDGGRYKTLDSFAREMMTSMYGRESLPGLSPLGSLFDWLFRRDAYVDAPVVRIKDKGLRIHFSAHMPDAARQRIVSTGYMTLRELADRTVRQRMAELATQTLLQTAMNRAREAQFVAESLERIVHIVPHPTGDATHAWHSPDELRANLPDDLLAAGGVSRAQVGPPIAEISSDQAVSVLGPWARLRSSWLQGDAAEVQNAVDALAVALPKLAPDGVYPAQSQRAAEAKYYAFGKFTWGYWLYMLAILVSVWALVTRWQIPYVAAFVLNLLAMGVHGYGLGLRWSILGRIPVANMFEAVVASACLGVGIALALELIYRKRIFLLAAAATGFLSLVLGAYVIPGGGTLTSIMGILDDVMLRIHTVLIILSYALIALAAVIAIAYLFGYYLVRAPQQSSEAGLMITTAGLAVWAVISLWLYNGPVQLSGARVAPPQALTAFGLLATVAALLLPFVRIFPRALWFHGHWALGVLAFSGALIALTPYGFVRGTAMTMAVGGFCWVVATLIGTLLRRVRAALSAPATARGHEAVALAGASPAMLKNLKMERPIMAGGAPGDEGQGSKLPEWLHHFDWCHLIILNMVFVMLFVGIILGAIWADYSWGRPWGWDPKEVFALNTWIIYAILIHIRFVTKNRGLWTAWLSVAGCAMMAFNWCFVNFFIVGLHSYA